MEPFRTIISPSFCAIFAFVLATALAQYPDSQYGPPLLNSFLTPQGPPQDDKVNEAPADLKVFRHIFVHSVPDDEPQESQVRRIRGPGGDEKHVNVIFVKAPAPAAPDQHIVDVPNENGRKTLVYVLLKKAAKQPDIEFSKAPPTPASKPEVYFIRYKDDPSNKTTPAIPRSAYGAPAQQPFSGYYGAPEA